MSNLKGRDKAVRRSLWLAMAYLVAGGLWILFSDRLAVMLIDSPELFQTVQTWKGWAFVAVTALLLFLILRQLFRKDDERLRLQLDQQEDILRLSQFQKSVIDNASIWINVLDPSGRILLWNKAAEAITGYSADEVVGRDDIWLWLYPNASYREEVFATVTSILSGATEVEGFETRISTRYLGERLIEWSSRQLTNSTGDPVGSIAIGMDMTEQRHAQQGLRERERQLATLMDSLPGMAYRCLYDEHWTMKFASTGCLDLTGYSPEEVLDNRRVSWAQLIVPGQVESLTERVEIAIAAAEPFSLEYQLRRKDGEIIWVWERGRAVSEGEELVLEGIILDLTDRKQLEAQLLELATLDSLTGQPNRRETERVLQDELARARRYGRQLAVLWVDLDYFKRVNDSHGHATGDEVLRTVSLRLADNIRSADTLGRYGGEEFIIVLPEQSVQEAQETAERLRQCIASEPVATVAGESVPLTISIGVAVYPDHADTSAALCEAADRAMYCAKDAGRNRVAVALPLSGEVTASERL